MRTLGPCEACGNYAQIKLEWLPLFKGETLLYLHQTCNGCGSTRIPQGVGTHTIDTLRWRRRARRARRAA